MDLPLNSANETRAADPILTVEMLFQILKGFLRKSFSNGSGGVSGGVQSVRSVPNLKIITVCS